MSTRVGAIQDDAKRMSKPTRNLKVLHGKFKAAKKDNTRSYWCSEFQLALKHKLDRISRNWPSANLKEETLIQSALTPGYLDQLIELNELELVIKSEQEIALQKTPRKKKKKLIDDNGLEHEYIVGDNKILVRNGLKEKRQVEVWTLSGEHSKIKDHLLKKSTKDKSVWATQISKARRMELEENAILHGSGKFFSKDRIDFVFDCKLDIGHLKQDGGPSSLLYVEFKREALLQSRRPCLFHGFPISKQYYQSF
jgi:hypothetical protein